jgi:hypothetical protein
MIGVRLAFTVLLAVTFVSCTDDDEPKARMESTIAASEAMMHAFRDSVRGEGQDAQASRTRAALSLRAPDSLDACSYPLPAQEVTRHTLDLVTIELPADFKLTRNGDGEPMKKTYGYSRYEWTGSDHSRVIIEPVNNHEAHSGWTGLLESECNVDIGPRSAHLDVANASVDYEDRIIHAGIDMVPYLAVSFVAHARSRQRQAELLNAVHTLRVRPGWGVKE